MTEAFTISAPQVGDAAAIADFAQACFAETFAHMNYPADDLVDFFAIAMSAERFAERIADPRFVVLTAHDGSGAITGFCTIGPNALPMPEGEPAVTATRELYQLYLAPVTHGTGLADRFMQAVKADADAHAAVAVYLSVYAGNHRAQRFYQRHGFTEYCKTTFHVGNTVDDERIYKWAR